MSTYCDVESMTVMFMWLCYIDFCFNDTSTTEIYTYCHTLSLRDALPIVDNVDDLVCVEIRESRCKQRDRAGNARRREGRAAEPAGRADMIEDDVFRSEEHTSELQ